jgi:hypothetical protein
MVSEEQNSLGRLCIPRSALRTNAQSIVRHSREPVLYSQHLRLLKSVQHTHCGHADTPQYHGDRQEDRRSKALKQDLCQWLEAGVRDEEYGKSLQFTVRVDTWDLMGGRTLLYSWLDMLRSSWRPSIFAFPILVRSVVLVRSEHYVAQISSYPRS